MSHNCHSRRLDQLRSLPALPLVASATGAGQESDLVGGDGEVSELNFGANSTTVTRVAS